MATAARETPVRPEEGARPSERVRRLDLQLAVAAGGA